MEKLYNLLDEFIKEKDILIIDGSIYNIDINQFLTKKAGFIERLVKNDKIEYQTFGNAFGTKYLESPVGSDNHEKISDYLDIIKLLAVSDTPIEDLVSYLKE